MHIHDELSSRVQAIEGLLQERERGKHEGPVASYVGRSAVGGWTRDYLPSTSKGGYVGRWEGVMVAIRLLPENPRGHAARLCVCASVVVQRRCAQAPTIAIVGT